MMKIVQKCNYTPPAKNSMGAERMVEALSDALVNLGHIVYMWLDENAICSPVDGTILVKNVPQDTDIVHIHGWNNNQNYQKYGKPWVGTIHGGGSENDPSWLNETKGNKNIICVSKFISDRIGAPNYAWTCSKKEDFIYEEKKENYFLWLAGTDWGEGKGIFTAIKLAKKMKINLKIAGTGKNNLIIEQIKSLCDNKIQYVGAVNGEYKAHLLSKAKALLFPTMLPDACPVVVSEALLSGTPIITTNNGAMPEIVNEKVGFICKNELDFVKAIANINKIKPQDCFEYGLNNFSSDVCAKKHLQIYEKTILNYGLE